jgi:hypothetical protein
MRSAFRLHSSGLVCVLYYCWILSVEHGAAASFRRLPWHSFVNIRGGEAHDSDNAPTYTIVNETLLYDGWRKLTRRRVRFPISNLEVDFEIVGQIGTDQAVLVFVWNTQTQTATMIREYMPAVHQHMMGLAAGMVEEKHRRQSSGDANADEENDDDDIRLTAAKHELEEECRMKGGTWHRVTQQDSAMDKYSSTKLSVYLVIDPVSVSADEALPRDATEEGMEVVDGMTIPEILKLIADGRMTVVGGWACHLAIHKLREMGQIK